MDMLRPSQPKLKRNPNESGNILGCFLVDIVGSHEYRRSLTNLHSLGLADGNLGLASWEGKGRKHFGRSGLRGLSASRYCPLSHSLTLTHPQIVWQQVAWQHGPWEQDGNKSAASLHADSVSLTLMHSLWAVRRFRHFALPPLGIRSAHTRNAG